ncbi:MAG: hypothetical protein PSX79_06830 [bacterium]|nr:hypothetical protein [bacterium]
MKNATTAALKVWWNAARSKPGALGVEHGGVQGIEQDRVVSPATAVRAR